MRLAGDGTDKERHETEDGAGNTRCPGADVPRRGHRVLQTAGGGQDEAGTADGILQDNDVGVSMGSLQMSPFRLLNCLGTL